MTKKKTEAERKTYDIPTYAYEALVEALRRFVFFAIKRDGAKWTLDDVKNAWTGLGTSDAYETASRLGFMKTVDDNPTPRVANWWQLTEAGAKILLHWKKNRSFSAKDFEITKRPPRRIPVRLKPEKP